MPPLPMLIDQNKIFKRAKGASGGIKGMMSNMNFRVGKKRQSEEKEFLKLLIGFIILAAVLVAAGAMMYNIVKSAGHYVQREVEKTEEPKPSAEDVQIIFVPKDREK